MKISCGCFLLLLIAAPAARAQDAIAKARELYTAAEYDDALTMLDGLAAGKHGLVDKQAVELYRSLCLLAIGRRDEADKAIEGIIAEDLLFRPGDDISPRMRTVFTEARQRLLPVLIQQHYQQAKGAFDRKEFAAAASGFKRIIDTFADPDMAQAAAESPLSDLKTLAAGFHDLSVKAIPPPPAPPPVAVAPPPQPPRVYTTEDRLVVAPVAIQQELPKYPGRVRPGGMTGVVEVVINEMGLVDSASTVVSLGTAYDELVTTAATRWQYYPARSAEGKPVKFRKRIQITVASQPGAM